MSKSSKSILPLLLAAVCLQAGCDSSKSEPSANTLGGEQQATAESQPASATTSNPEPSDAADANESQSDGQQNAAVDRGAQIREMLKPEALSKTLDSNIAKFTETLDGITDRESVKAATPTLKEFGSSINIVATMYAFMPPESLKVLSEKLKASKEPIQAKIDEIYEDDETARALRPAVSSILRNIDGLVATIDRKLAKLAEEEAEEEAEEDEEAEVDSDSESSEDADAETENATDQ